MDKVLYNSLYRYFTTLAKIGTVSYNSVNKLLVLIFYKHFIYEDYRGNLSKEDYNTIEKALDCLFGSTCLIPYPNYLEMGKLHLGDMTEMAHRITDNESYTQEVDNRLKYNETITGDNVKRIVNAETRLDAVEGRTTVVEGRLNNFKGAGETIETWGTNTDNRLTIIESTKVLKNKQEVLEVPDIVF